MGGVDDQSPSGVPKPVLIVAVTLTALLAVAVAALGGYSRYTQHQQEQQQQAAEQARRSGPLPLAPVPAAEADTPECRAVLDALPAELELDGDRVPRRQLAEPAPPATVAWGDRDHDPVVLRCGLDDPAELTPTSKLVDVSGVSWFELAEGSNSTWLAVDRPVRVALTLPAGTGTGPIQDISELLAKTLTKQPVFP